MTKYQQGLPVNSYGEIVLSGTNQAVVGILPIDMLPVDNDGGLKLGHLTMIVNTIADLKALAAGQFPSVQVLGYYAAGDGGGDIFRWNSASTAADNGGTVIIPNSAPGTGRWERVYETINVKKFGAKGDGVTDDTAAIQATINAVSTDGGGTVIIPPSNGSYRVTLTHQTPTSYSFHKIALLLKSDVQIYAVGAKIEAFKNVDTHGGFVSFEGCTNATVVGGEWLGDKSLHVSLPAGEFCFAFFINAAKRCGIWDAVIRDSRGDGIYVGGCPTATFDSTKLSYDTTISNNKIINCGRNGISITGAQRFVVANNIITGTWGYAPQAGIDIEPDFTYSGNWGSVDGLITGNVITENRGDGLAVFRSFGLTVSGNTITRSGEKGVSLRGDIHTSAINGNTIKFAGLYATTDSADWFGIFMDEAAGAISNVTITGNTVDAAKSFHVRASQSCTVANNEFYASGDAAYLWGSLGTGTANTNSYFTSYITSAGDSSVVFRNNTYRVLTTEATWRGESTFFVGITKSSVVGNTFYNANAGLNIRLNGGGGTTPHEFHLNMVNENLSVGQNAVGWWSATNVDFSRSYLNGTRATHIYVKTNSPAIGWVMPTITGNKYEYAYGYVSGSTYMYRVWDGAAWKLSGAYV